MFISSLSSPILKTKLCMPDSLSNLSHVFEKWKAWDFSRDPKNSWKCGGHRFWELTGPGLI